MGLTPQHTAVVAPAATGILDPRTGAPVGAIDPYFVGLNEELADKGFWLRPPTISSSGRARAR